MKNDKPTIKRLEELISLVSGVDYDINIEEISGHKYFFIAPRDEADYDSFYEFLKSNSINTRFEDPTAATISFLAIRSVWVEHHARIDDVSSCINRLTNIPF